MVGWQLQKNPNGTDSMTDNYLVSVGSLVAAITKLPQRPSLTNRSGLTYPSIRSGKHWASEPSIGIKAVCSRAHILGAATFISWSGSCRVWLTVL
jgi:hypothetical protein